MFASYSIWQRKTIYIILPIIIGSVLGILTLVAISLPLRTSVLIIIAILAPIIAVISGQTKRLLLFLVVLDISLNIDINPGHDPTIVGTPNGYSISVANISMLILYAIWLIEMLYNSKNKPLFFSQMSLPMLGLIGASLLSLFNAVDTTFGFFEIIQLTELFLVAFYIANHIRERKDVKAILYALVAGLLVQSILVIIQFVTKTQFDLLGNISETGSGLFRPNGTFGHPNGVAGYTVPLLAITISLFFAKTRNISKVLSISALLLGVVTLVASLSRGGWISFIFVLWILLLGNIQFRVFKISPNIVLVSITSIFILAVLFGSSITYRVTNDYTPILSRLPLMTIAFNMISTHPIFGIGINNFGIVLADYTQGLRPGAWLYVVHSKYLILWAETGIIGFFFFLWLLYSMFRTGFQILRLRHSFYSPMALGIVAGLSGMMIHMFGDTFQTRGLVLILWALAGLLFGINNLARKELNLPENSTP
jgi:O-antigen ligase